MLNSPTISRQFSSKSAFFVHFLLALERNTSDAELQCLDVKIVHFEKQGPSKVKQLLAYGKMSGQLKV